MQEWCRGESCNKHLIDPVQLFFNQRIRCGDMTIMRMDYLPSSLLMLILTENLNQSTENNRVEKEKWCCQFFNAFMGSSALIRAEDTSSLRHCYRQFCWNANLTSSGRQMDQR